MPKSRTAPICWRGIEGYNVDLTEELTTDLDLALDPSLVLYLPLHQKDGTQFTDRSAHGHLCTAVGALWTPQGRTFDGSDDYLELNDSSTSSPLNFTSGNFSIIMVLKPSGITGFPALFSRGLVNADGYRITSSSGGGLRICTIQGGAYQQTAGVDGILVVDTWVTVGISRSGATIYCYKNGVVANDDYGVHIDPTTCARTTKIGILDDKVSSPVNSYVGELMVFNRALTVTEHMNIHLAIKWRYQ